MTFRVRGKNKLELQSSHSLSSQGTFPWLLPTSQSSNCKHIDSGVYNDAIRNSKSAGKPSWVFVVVVVIIVAEELTSHSPPCILYTSHTQLFTFAKKQKMLYSLSSFPLEFQFHVKTKKSKIFANSAVYITQKCELMSGFNEAKHNFSICAPYSFTIVSPVKRNQKTSGRIIHNSTTDTLNRRVQALSWSASSCMCHATWLNTVHIGLHQ